jgi:hypothetical protein
MLSGRSIEGTIMINVALDVVQQMTALDSPRKRFSKALKASRQLQSDGRRLGHDRVDLYYEDAEGNWLESWQENK